MSVKRTLPFARLLLLLMAIVLLAAFFLAGRGNLSAAVESDSVSDGVITEVMRRMLAEDQKPGELGPLGATPCVGGMAGIYPCNNVDLLSVSPHSSLGGTGLGNDLWGWTDPVDGTEYALVGQSNGVAFVDVSDPINPEYIGRLNSHTGVATTWRDVKVYADHAFVVSDSNPGHGMQVFDLNELRTVVNPPVIFSNTAHYSGIGSAHNVAINEDTGYAYIVGGSACSSSGGLEMVDISTPTTPTLAGCFPDDGYTHDVQCVIYNGPDTEHQGSEICFAANEDTLTIVDVTDKSNPDMLSRLGYTGEGYSHQGWLTDDHAYFLLDDELDESFFGNNTTTYLWDISDLDAPVNFANYVSALPTIDHNLYILGNRAYESNYTSGLRIINLDDLANGNLFEEAFFDTYPTNNSVGFTGQWSNYPYFESGIIIANDRNNGLFVLQLQTGGGPTPTATSPAPTSTSPAPTATSPAETATSPAETATSPASTATTIPPTATSVGSTPTATAPATGVEMSSFDGQTSNSWLFLLILVAIGGLLATYIHQVKRE